MMDDILAKKNRHLFLEEKDNQNNSFIGNVNTLVNDLENIDTVADNITDVKLTGESIESVNTVAANIEDINNASTNIDTVKTFNDNVNNGTMQYLLEAFTTSLNEQGNAWEVRLTQLGESILATTSAFNYSTVVTISSDIPANGTLILPNAMKYKVGTHMLMVSWNGTVCYAGDQYDEVGAYGVWATSIKLNQPAKVGDKIQLRIVALTDQSSYVDITEAAINASQFVASGSNTERYLPEFLGDVVNVKNFGAAGNGVNDDTTAFQSAIATGKAVFVPEGTYKLTTDVTGNFCSTGNSIFTGGTINGSTILRGTAQKNNDIINVKDFGAKCDGVHDDTVALQAAIDAAALNGCAVQIEGAILIDSDDITVKRDVCIIGDAKSMHGYMEGSKQSTIWLNGEYSIIMEMNASIVNVRVINKDLQQADAKIQTTLSSFSGTAIKSTNNAKGFTLQSVSVLGFNKAIYLDTVNHIKIYGFMTDSEDGIDAKACTYAYFEDCLFENIGYSYVTIPDIHREGSKGVVFYNCNSFTLINCMTHCHEAGYDISNSTKVFLKGCVANYKSIHVSNSFVGIKIKDSTYCCIEGSESSHYGNSFIVDGSDIRATGNIFRDWWQYGIKIIGTSKAVVVGNILLGGSNTAYGVFLGSTILEAIITGNELTGMFNEDFQTELSRTAIPAHVIIENNTNFTIDFKNFGSQSRSIEYKVGSEAADYGTQQLFYSCKGSLNNPQDIGDSGTIATFRGFGFTGTAYEQLAAITLASYGNAGGGIRFGTKKRNGSFAYSRLIVTDEGHFIPGTDNVSNLGAGSLRYANVYSATGSINTSDERLKEEIQSVSNNILEAWGNVHFKTFKFKEAIEKKGASARIHVGVIAQDIENAFKSKGLNGFDLGLLCYDKWEAKEWAEKDENTGEEIVYRTEAGDRYSLRYDEVLALECAYLRNELKKQNAKIEALMQRISALENNR